MEWAGSLVQYVLGSSRILFETNKGITWSRMMPEPKPWILPGRDTGCYLVVLKGDKKFLSKYKQLRPSLIKDLLGTWLDSDEDILKDIYRKSAQQATKDPGIYTNAALLKRLLFQEFQFGRVVAFEAKREVIQLEPVFVRAVAKKVVPSRQTRTPVRGTTPRPHDTKAPYPPSQPMGRSLPGLPTEARLPAALAQHPELARPSPTPFEEVEKRRVDIKQLSVAMKVRVALHLSVKSWPGQIAEAALQSFRDPQFVITLFGIMGLYVALWLTPDPTMLTKVLAGMLTAALLAQFAWEDIYGLVEAWFALENQCERATTLAELQAAGDTFAEKVGQVGFDILLFIVMGRVTKRVQPKLREVGAKRAVARAEAKVEAAQRQPGSGFVLEAQGEALEVLEVAKAEAKSADPGRVLDALNKSMPEPARQGLAQLRGRVGDTRALQTLESALGKGRKDLGSFLSHQGVPEAQAKATKASVLKSQAELARARMNKLKTLQDPLLREAMSEELVHYTLRVLRSLKNPPDWALIRESIRTRNIEMLVGEMGEALQRSLLAEKYPVTKGYRIFANIEVVRQVKNFTRTRDWQAAERATGKSGDPGGLYETDGRLWKSITEVDALIAEPATGGKWRPVEMEQMKTGKNDQHIKAQTQNINALTAMKEIADGTGDVRLFDRISKNKLGEDMTALFELSTLQDVKTTTRGTVGKGFKQDIPFTREILEETARSLVKNPVLLPAPSTIPPPNQGQRQGDNASQRVFVR